MYPSIALDAFGGFAVFTVTSGVISKIFVWVSPNAGVGGELW